MHGLIRLLAFVCLSLLGGCSELPGPAARESEEPETALAQAFDPSETGTIRGRVVWDGDPPKSEEFLIRASAYNPYLYQNPARFSTPHIPKVQPKTQGVENAVVYLRGVDPRRSKAWDHASVRVVFQDRELRIKQGKSESQVGFVRRGSTIEVVNSDTEYHNLHARGAVFFAMPLIEANQVHERMLAKVGVVDLTCATGNYWLHAHLFVTEHPYYVRTDANGQFVLDQVPAGTYEVVCWLPSWHVERKEVDPETGIIARLAWALPQERVQTIQVRGDRESEITYRWKQAMFTPN
jgi:hypothetical protein